MAPQTIAYDEAGNPISYLGATLTWKNGRQLASYTKGTKSVTYEYNESGLRTKKTVNKNGTITTYNYTWSEDKLTHQVWGNNYLHFYYDYNDEIVGFEYFDGTTVEYYTYVKNMQGDVVAIINSDGVIDTTYEYDAWGRSKGSSGGLDVINPIRYRGYYYDEEISMYYLQSRYYDPMIGRFINADDVERFGYAETLLMYNVFSYCENNPVMRIDHAGYKWYKNFNAYKKDLAKGMKKISLTHYLDVYKEYKNNVAYIKSCIKNKLPNPNKDYIFSQHFDNVKGLIYGVKNFSYNGCEMVATYNVLRYLQKTKKIQNIIKQFSLNGLRWRNGKWGTKPYNLKLFFDENDINYTYYNSFKLGDFQTSIKENKIYIVNYWDLPKGYYVGNPYGDVYFQLERINFKKVGRMHAIAFIYKNGKYEVYNGYDTSKRNQTAIYDKFEDIGGGRWFLCGYSFGKE